MVSTEHFKGVCMKFRISLLLPGLLFFGCFAAELSPLPDPVPVFRNSRSARQNPVFKVENIAFNREGIGIYKRPSFTVGNKAVILRKTHVGNKPSGDYVVPLFIDNKRSSAFLFWGSWKGNSGYPFKDLPDDPPKLEIDEKTETVTYTKPYLTPEGKRAVFTYRLKSLGNSRIELAWDMGVPQKELEKSKINYTVVPWFTVDDISGIPDSYRDKHLTFGGKEFKKADREKLTGKKASTPASGDFVYDTANPLKGYKIEFGELRGTVTESVYVPKAGKDRYSICYRTFLPGRRFASGKIVIDFGEAAVARKNTPPPVGGIDFWKADATHVPVPPVRNLFPNPGFEQGLRYWRWIGGGATYRPDRLPRYEIVPQGLFGKNALLIRDTQPGAPGMACFPMALEPGKKYTLSFYAKADAPRDLRVSFASAAKGGKYEWYPEFRKPESYYKISAEWKRYSRTFTADAAGFYIVISGGGNTLIDGIQLERGEHPTEFISAPVEGLLTTSNPDNDLVFGKPIGASFSFLGKSGTRGEALITVRNPFNETVYSGTLKIAIGGDGVQKVPLPFDPEKFGMGVFAVKAEYRLPGMEPYFDFYRLSIMKPLSNTHATKDVFGTSGAYGRITRGEDLARKYMEWGFGSTSWGNNGDLKTLIPYLQKKYRISNYYKSIIDEDRKMRAEYRKWTKVTPEIEKQIEEQAYKTVKTSTDATDQYFRWGFANEEEGSVLIRNGEFDEYFKAQYAACRGIRRANPKALVLPTCGTSGYSLLRGYDAIEGYLKAARKHGVKYDAIAVHPYGNADKGTLSSNDLDEETARLLDQMKRYGYGKETPVYYTEMFNIPETYVPAWGADTAYDIYQAGKPTYDFGNREFIQACTAARAYIIMLKYWPQVQHSNVWIFQPYLDQYLTPTILCKAVNTLGTHLGYVEYQADVRPAPGIRGYVFKLKDGTGIAPVWCISHDVENGIARGPLIQVGFQQPVEFCDLMGNRRSAGTDKNGKTEVRLTPAPLLIKAENADLLAKALQNAETDDSSSALSVSFRPDLTGTISASVRNHTGRVQKGTLEINGGTLNYSIKPDGAEIIPLPGNRGHRFGKMYRWNSPFKIKPLKGGSQEKVWNMDYFYVPKTDGMPDWSKIPAIPLRNRYVQEYTVSKPGEPARKIKPPAGYPGDLDAVFKMAWDKEHLYLRVEAEDDKFLTFPELWKRNGKVHEQLWNFDGCLEVYFDCGANGRTNIAKTYDNDDYRYDFAIGRNGKSGPGTVCRFRAVYHQLADGVNMATKEEAAKKIKCDFQRTGKGYSYTITFGQRYIEPIVLRKGFIAGFGMFLHDRDDEALHPGIKGLSLATEPGSHCDYKPHLWPLMILAE